MVGAFLLLLGFEILYEVLLPGHIGDGRDNVLPVEPVDLDFEEIEDLLLPLF